MHFRKSTRLLALPLLTACGVAAAAALTLAPSALAWSPDNVPPGWTVSTIGVVGAPAGTYCITSYRIFTTGHADISPAFCADSPTFQQDFDAWIDARYTAPVTTTQPPAATTTVVITTTTTTPAATTTDAAPPGPAPSAPSPTTTTNVVTVVTTATPVEQSLQAQIDALMAQVASLTARVDKLDGQAVLLRAKLRTTSKTSAHYKTLLAQQRTVAVARAKATKMRKQLAAQAAALEAKTP